MPLIVVCPTCGAKMRAPDNAIGRQARCPGCKELVTITGPEGDPELSAPEPEPEPEERSRGVRAERDAPSSGRSRDREEEEEDRPRRRSRRGRDEDEDRPRRRRAAEQPGLSIASLILGICSVTSLCTCFCVGGLSVLPSGTLGVLAVVLGIMGMNKGGRGMAISGIATGAVGLVFGVSMMILHMVGVAATSFAR